jgi:hypothetical protein
MLAVSPLEIVLSTLRIRQHFVQGTVVDVAGAEDFVPYAALRLPQTRRTRTG